MYQSQVLTHYDLLPESYKKEADDFIEDLFLKASEISNGKKSNCRDGFGSLKGLIKIADDFDEPLEDFKEYM
ncbi:MAG: DUF2281 domain-containing protein [bacterium]